MKNLIRIFSLLLLAGFVFACEGPMGPAGLDGVDGVDGTNGTNGVDGTAKCSVCHTNSATIIAVQHQYEHSQHFMGTESAYTNGRTGGECQKCHMHEGFTAFVAGQNVHVNVANPTQPNCYTCHNVHKNFDATDWALTSVGSVTFMNGIGGPYNNAGGTGVGAGASNLCAQCHQARAASPAIPAVGGADVVLASNQTRWGPHYSSVSNIMTNTGGYNIAGALPYDASHAHKSLTCTSCHMAKPYGAKAGGHTMNLRYNSHGTDYMLQTGCSSCHTESSSAFLTKMNNAQAATQALLDELKTELIRLGIYNASTSLANPGTYSADIAGAFFNYKIAVGDGDDAGGLYAHNPPYTKALLQNSIDALKLLPTP